MSPARQEELSRLLNEVMGLPAVRKLDPDPRLSRVHYDWLAAGEVVQRTVARLSEQLRRFLDDKVWMENRLVMRSIHAIEHQALAVRAAPPPDPFMAIDEPAPDIALPMERPLFSPPYKPKIAEAILIEGGGETSADALFDQVYVDKAALGQRVRRLLSERDQVSLADVVAAHPVERGLAEIVAYLSLASDDSRAHIEESQTQHIPWMDATGRGRQATVPLVLFLRESPGKRKAP